MSVYWNAVPDGTTQPRSTTVIAGRNVHINPGRTNTTISVAPFVVPEVRAKTSVALASYVATATTLIATAFGVSTSFDGVTLIAGDRILIDSVGTSSDAHNGIYTVTDIGGVSSYWVFTRTSDEIVEGTLVYVTSGTLYARTGWSRIQGAYHVFAQYSATFDVTGGNIGSTGVGIFNALNANVIELKKIAGTGAAVVTDHVGESIELSVDSSAITHADLAGLNADDHTQYTLLAGRSGGQTLSGSTLTGQNLTLRPNAANTTTGSVIVNASTASSSTTTGALRVAGGVGVVGKITAGTIDVVSGDLNVSNGIINGVNLENLNNLVTSFPANLPSLPQYSITQIANIDDNISMTQWYYLSQLNQTLRDNANVNFNEIGGTLTTGTQPNIVHNSMSGLTTGDPHTQYVLAAGRGTAQTITSGTVASTDLTLRSTTHGTKGKVYLDETTQSSSISTGALVVDGGVGIAKNLYVGNSGAITGNLTVGGTINTVNINTLNSTVAAYASNLSSLNSTIIGELINIGATTINSAKWTALGAMGSANGVAQLDGTTKILFSQLPTGTTSSTVAVGDHTHSWRITGTVATDANLTTPFTLPNFVAGTFNSGVYRVAIYCTIGNGPSAVFEICKSTGIAANGSVVRVVSQSAGSAALNMQWLDGEPPKVYHTSAGSTTNVTYSYVINY